MAAHLDDDIIAAIVDGMNRDSHREAIAHLGECSECRARLVAVANLLDDSAITEEIEKLDPSVRRGAPRRWTPAYWGAAATLAAAAAVTIVLVRPDNVNLRPNGSVVSTETHREGTVTTTMPPRILSPASIGRGDSLRWTSVTGADLYRVQVWDREGNVVLSTDTRDTVLAFPRLLAGKGGSYLWEVKARTGWDRWVSSDFLELTVRTPSTR